MTDDATSPAPPELQLTLDAADPHELAEFWAAVLGYEVEDHDEMIRSLVDGGVAPAEATMERGGRLVWTDAAACRDPRGRRPRLLLQRVPEAKTVKNRMHLDVHVGAERRDEEVRRLEGLGATRLHDGQQGPLVWVTMADPEGNEFCVA